MMRRLSLGLLSGFALAGCTGLDTGFVGQVAETAVDQVLGREAELPAPLPAPTRGAVPPATGASIAIGRIGVPATAVVAAATTQGDGYVVYQDPTRRSIVLHGGQVSGTQGFLYDLAAVKSAPDDPVVVATPLSEWPDALLRNYQFTLQSAPDYQISVSCVIGRGESGAVIVADEVRTLTRVVETCANDVRSFTNLYWIEPDTGYIWKSAQWVGPRSPAITVDIIDPYRPG